MPSNSQAPRAGPAPLGRARAAPAGHPFRARAEPRSSAQPRAACLRATALPHDPLPARSCALSLTHPQKASAALAPRPSSSLRRPLRAAGRRPPHAAALPLPPLASRAAAEACPPWHRSRRLVEPPPAHRPAAAAQACGSLLGLAQEQQRDSRARDYRSSRAAYAAASSSRGSTSTSTSLGSRRRSSTCRAGALPPESRAGAPAGAAAAAAAAAAAGSRHFTFFSRRARGGDSELAASLRAVARLARYWSPSAGAGASRGRVGESARHARVQPRPLGREGTNDKDSVQFHLNLTSARLDAAA